MEIGSGSNHPKVSLSATCGYRLKTRVFACHHTFDDFRAILSAPKFRIFLTLLRLAIASVRYKDNAVPPNEFGRNPDFGNMGAHFKKHDSWNGECRNNANLLAILNGKHYICNRRTFNLTTI